MMFDYGIYSGLEYPIEILFDLTPSTCILNGASRQGGLRNAYKFRIINVQLLL